MTTRRYLNFDLLLEHDGDGQYEARVTAAPVAGLPHVQFRLPFDEKSLKILLMELDPGRTDVRGVDGAVQQQAAKEFGGPLFDAIFTGKAADAWTRSLGKAAAEKAGGLRLRLRVADDAADLAGLPWELCTTRRGGPFLLSRRSRRSSGSWTSRTTSIPSRSPDPSACSPSSSSPTGLRRLEVEREWAHLETAMGAKVREGLVVLDRLPEPTVDALGEWLLDHDTHVIHFVGHGDFNPAGDGEGFIFFQDELGGADPVSAAVLGPFIHDHDALRMVVINACRTARVGRTDPYGGMAQGLVLQGATAVVAMQFPITDPAAVLFTGKFYGALAAGLPVDQAVELRTQSLARQVPQRVGDTRALHAVP